MKSLFIIFFRNPEEENDVDWEWAEHEFEAEKNFLKEYTNLSKTDIIDIFLVSHARHKDEVIPLYPNN